MTVAEALSALRARGPDRAAESALLGEWLLTRAGLDHDPDEVAVAPGCAGDRLELLGDRLSGVARRVPRARDASWIAVLASNRVALAPRAAATIEPHVNLAGESRDTVSFERAPARCGTGVASEELLMRGALVRVAMIAGALERLYEIAVRHAEQRRQFGRPIGSFQAVQQHLVTIAQQAALAGVGADAAAHSEGGFEIAAGKLLTNRAALIASRAAHQVLGARGTTRAHPLSELTRGLWAWRSEYGDEHYWSTRLGAAVMDAGADRLYPAITGGSKVLSV
jgi:acyl-CoA dehydrogenase